MPRCPKCAKRFKTHLRVIQHMNQPRSSCANWIQELVRIEDALPRKKPRSENAQTLPEDTQGDVLDQDIEVVIFERDAHNRGKSMDSDDTTVDEFPGASRTYGQGPTFMDEFDKDVYAENRRDNLYYPFASKQDWEVGHFLESSTLSMGAIDKFLKLELVSTRYLILAHYSQVHTCRSGSSLSHSIPPRSCAVGLSYFLPARSGSPKPFTPIIPQNLPFNCSIVTPSNVSSLYSVIHASLGISITSLAVYSRLLKSW
jgi:hypothetical protein